ncbi:MAG TPA: CBS domain-containing protein [Gaiellaceae bacterium]
MPSTRLRPILTGQAMMIVEQIMSRDVLSVAPSASLKDVARLLLEHDVSGVPVVAEDGRVLGVVSSGDILVKVSADLGRRRHPSNWLFGSDERVELKREAQTAAEAMTRPAVTVDPGCAVAGAARLMVRRAIDRLPVVDHGRLVGIVTRRDVVRAFARPDDELAEQIRSEVLVETLWIDPGTVDVTVEDGDVTVTGTVESRTIAEYVQTFSSLVPGVTSVDVSHLDWCSGIEQPRHHSLL